MTTSLYQSSCSCHDSLASGGGKIVTKYATAGFVIYGAPIDQASFETMKTGIRRGVLKRLTDIYIYVNAIIGPNTGKYTCGYMQHCSTLNNMWHSLLTSYINVIISRCQYVALTTYHFLWLLIWIYEILWCEFIPWEKSTIVLWYDAWPYWMQIIIHEIG